MKHMKIRFKVATIYGNFSSFFEIFMVHYVFIIAYFEPLNRNLYDIITHGANWKCVLITVTIVFIGLYLITTINYCMTNNNYCWLDMMTINCHCHDARDWFLISNLWCNYHFHCFLYNAVIEWNFYWLTVGDSSDPSITISFNWDRKGKACKAYNINWVDQLDQFIVIYAQISLICIALSLLGCVFLPVRFTIIGAFLSHLFVLTVSCINFLSPANR